MSSEEFYRVSIIDTINRCEEKKALRFIYYLLNHIDPELRPWTQEERKAWAEFNGIPVEDTSETGTFTENRREYGR